MYALYRNIYGDNYNRNPYYNDQYPNQGFGAQHKAAYNPFYAQEALVARNAKRYSNTFYNYQSSKDSEKNTQDCLDNDTVTIDAALEGFQIGKDNNDGKANDNETSPSKGISPLGLVNELSRLHKVSHQYILTDETGPPHKRVFYVKLKLGEEEFSGTGASIKKAQHAAANEALTHTSLPRPLKKNNNAKKTAGSVNPCLTPTVELNALGMKLGKSVVYRVVRNSNYHSRHFNEPRNLTTTLSRMEVEVDGRVYSGQGYFLKQAKNACASAALADLRKVVMEGASSQNEKEADAENKSERLLEKSEISQVYEVALKRSLPVNFTVSSESGPGHMKHYQTTCSCGEVVAEGVGKSKKDSKRDSAVKMLLLLKQLPPLPPSPFVKKYKGPYKKAANKTPKLQKADPDLRDGFHPISRLYQIQQAKKQPEPLYKLVRDEGKGKNKKFLIEVLVGDKSCTAWASNIKSARVQATQAMLQLLGYVKPASNSFVATAANDDVPVACGVEKKLTLIDQDIESLAAESQSACAIEQLQHVALKLSFRVHFRHFPKNSEDSMHVTLVTLTTIPTLHCHGEAESLYESQKIAAKNALQQLGEFVAHMKVSLPATTLPHPSPSAAVEASLAAVVDTKQAVSQ